MTEKKAGQDAEGTEEASPYLAFPAYQMANQSKSMLPPRFLVEQTIRILAYSIGFLTFSIFLYLQSYAPIRDVLFFIPSLAWLSAYLSAAKKTHPELEIFTSRGWSSVLLIWIIFFAGPFLAVGLAALAPPLSLFFGWVLVQACIVQTESNKVNLDEMFRRSLFLRLSRRGALGSQILRIALLAIATVVITLFWGLGLATLLFALLEAHAAWLDVWKIGFSYVYFVSGLMFTSFMYPMLENRRLPKLIP